MSLKKWFKKNKKEENPKHEREFRELLRENLNGFAVDVFNLDDPLIIMTPGERREYLLYFDRMVKDKKLISRLEFFINKQANLTLKNSKDGILDTAGVMRMDGLSTFKDDVERLSQMFNKEESERPENKTPLSAEDQLREQLRL